jgi:hypothetical protein
VGVIARARDGSNDLSKTVGLVPENRHRKLTEVVRDHDRYACSKKGITTKETNIMALYMDIHHEVKGLTEDAVAGAHARDLEIQDKYDVKYLKY